MEVKEEFIYNQSNNPLYTSNNRLYLKKHYIIIAVTAEDFKRLKANKKNKAFLN